MKKFTASPIFKFLPDKMALKIMYKNAFLRAIDLKSPKTFNEKLQWLKLYNRDPGYTKMVDKYEAKKYVASVIGEEYIIPTYGVYNSFDEIDFDALPDQFVLKCTHGSGDVVIVRDKNAFDRDAAKAKLTKSLKTNYYKISREWPYKNVKPRIIAEMLLKERCNDGDDSEPRGIRDYKFMCFNGKMEYVFVCSGRFDKEGLHATFFDSNWNLMDFEHNDPSEKSGFPKPKTYSKMLSLSEELSKNIPFVRIDFYECDEKIYFGEITFFSGGGFEPFQPEEWDRKLGDLITLPEKYSNK